MLKEDGAALCSMAADRPHSDQADPWLITVLRLLNVSAAMLVALTTHSPCID